MGKKCTLLVLLQLEAPGMRLLKKCLSEKLMEVKSKQKTTLSHITKFLGEDKKTSYAKCLAKQISNNHIACNINLNQVKI
jgi:hypothetical protein